MAADGIEKTEKITINLGLVDLGEIDLLVAEGFYANRTDFIRSAIRRQLETRSGAVRDTVLVPPMAAVTVAFDAGEAARWMLHCHHMPHLATGMMTTLDLAA